MSRICNHMPGVIIGAKRVNQLQDNLAAVELRSPQTSLGQLDEGSPFAREHPGRAAVQPLGVS